MQNHGTRTDIDWAAQFVADTLGLPKKPEGSNLDQQIKPKIPENLRDLQAEAELRMRDTREPWGEVWRLINRVAKLEADLAMVRQTARMEEQDVKAVLDQGDTRKATHLLAALEKIADHQTQLPWGECARIAREAIAHYQS